MIEAIELTSTRRSRGAAGSPVEKISFDVYPGQVTALLGAPGAGKSTVLRLMVELEPGGGRTLFGGRPYHALRPAIREVGLALNPDAVHPGRTVQAHLQLYAAGGGVPKPRVAEVLEVAGLSTQATVRCGRLDPGQRQRLAIAAALIGDPAALILDEPHALDTHGMSWFHALIRAYAAQGRTVLVAASDPDILAGTADHVVVLRRDEHDGVSRVIASRSAAEVFEERRATVVQVRSPQAARLAAALESEGARLAPAGPGALQVRGLDRARIGEVAHVAGVCLHELCEIGHDDDVFGLRPVPRQKELLPGLTRTDATWHSGVRLIPDEIEEAELVEAEQPAVAEAAGTAVTASRHPLLGGGEKAEAWRSQGSMTSGSAQAEGAVATEQPVDQPQARPLQDSVMSIGAQTVAASGEQTAQADDVAGARLSQGSVSSATEPAAATDATHGQPHDIAEMGWQAAQPSGRETTAADQQTDQKPSTVGSWRTQGSVAGSRWSAVKGSQASGDRRFSTAAASANPAPRTTPESAEPVPVSPAPAPTVDLSGAPSLRGDFPPARSHDVVRRTTAFGLRWGRGKPQQPAPASASTSTAASASASSAQTTAAAPVLIQPAVPFTVAPPAAEQSAAEDGMTPWRAVTARASKQSQQASAAEAAQAEQEASA